MMMSCDSDDGYMDMMMMMMMMINTIGNIVTDGVIE
jgi:hypothetical protein